MEHKGILVEFRFDGEKKSEVGRFTYEQYLNLRDLPITTLCKIVDNAEHVLSEEDMSLINEKIKKATTGSHTKNLSKND